MLLLPHTPASGAHEVCRRLRHDLEQAPWRMHASFGVASYSSQHSSPKSLLRLAEEGLDTAREME
jgi:GGDEF domain-containing protein